MSENLERMAYERMAYKLDSYHGTVAHMYLTMPGSPSVPKDADGHLMWDKVIGNDHWRFCALIYTVIQREIEARVLAI